MLDVVTIFVRMVTESKQAEDLISILPPLLNLMMENEDVNLLTHAIVTLKTFIMYQQDAVLKQ